MTLTIKKSNSQNEWYQRNKQRLSAKRKKLYAEDPEYRQRALEASRRRARGERIPPRPPDAQISFAEAATQIGVGISTVHEWRRKELFPEPKYHNRALWFTEKQVSLLKELDNKYASNGCENAYKYSLSDTMRSIVHSKWKTYIMIRKKLARYTITKPNRFHSRFDLGHHPQSAYPVSRTFGTMTNICSHTGHSV